MKTFLAIQDAIDYLKMNSNVEGLFVVHDVEYLKPKIIHAFQRGDRQALHNLLYPSSEEITRIQETAVPGGRSVDARIALECSSALIAYLVDLPKPLLPLRVQRLVLGGNEGIPVENVAQDALGVLKQDLAGRHLALATSFMELLNVVIRKSLSSELGGPSIVLFLFPTLFQYCPADLQSFLNAATIFNEMISLAPRILGPREHPTMDARESTSDTVQSIQSVALPNFPPAYFSTGQEGRRRLRRRSPLRCRLDSRDGGPDDLFPIWGSRTPGILHPVLTGGTV
ncbi:hypothetical protein J437_LFUL019755 [Ladona fulva]|uniref:Uncharacterized protein n=1 Tax=Ladona fulva TaxID=123851 RepID=A0A8K0KSG4_LADFU|nr:hypothetical protein J437_LFUL019755 [Ladona fulva]